jgi:hypothetical protein
MLRQATWLLTVRPCPHSSMRQAASSNCNILGHTRTANKLAQRATEQAPGDLLPGLRNILGHQQEGLVRSWAYPGFNKNGMKNGIFRSKTGFRKYGRTNVLPFSVPLQVDHVPFSVPFPFIPEKTETDRKIRYMVADGTGFIPSVFIFECVPTGTKYTLPYQCGPSDDQSRGQQVDNAHRR